MQSQTWFGGVSMVETKHQMELGSKVGRAVWQAVCGWHDLSSSQSQKVCPMLTQAKLICETASKVREEQPGIVNTGMSSLKKK